MTINLNRKAFIRKIILFSVILAGILALLTPTLVADAQTASSVKNVCETFGTSCPAVQTPGVEGTKNLIGQVINWLTGIGVVVGVLFVVFGAFKMITSVGNAKGFGDGISTITNALIGVAVLLVAGTIVRFVVNIVLGIK